MHIMFDKHKTPNFEIQVKVNVVGPNKHMPHRWANE